MNPVADRYDARIREATGAPWPAPDPEEGIPHPWVVRLVLGAICAFLLFALLACGRGSPTGIDPEPAAKPSSVIGAEYFPHEVGRTWVLRNEAHPERVTTISMVQRNGALAMWFEKNHPDTYHGAEGTNNNLLWFLRDDRGWIAPGNTAGGPDDVRISRASGRDVMHIWLRTSDSTPVCFLIPTGSLAVPSERSGTFQYTVQVMPSAYGLESAHGLWRVQWDLPTSDPSLLRIRFDETYSDGPGFVYEDWWLRRGVGLVGIRQWYDAGRTQLRRSVVAENLP